MTVSGVSCGGNGDDSGEDSVVAVLWCLILAVV